MGAKLMKSKRYIVTTTRTVETTSVITAFSEEEAVKLADNEDTGGILNAVRGAERVAYQQERVRSWSLIKVINKRASKLFPNW